MTNDYITECVSDLLKYYKERDFIQMAFAYDEIQICKGLKMADESVFFTEVLDGNKFKVSKALLGKIEYGGEPILVSTQNKWNLVSFDTMYEGVKFDEIPMPDDVASPVELIRISLNQEVVLHDECVKILDIKQGDIIMISAMSEGFYITKFTEENIKSFL